MLRKKVGIDQIFSHLKGNSASPPLPLLDNRILCRVDFNVPIQNGQVSDARRISESLPTINKILDAGTPLLFP
jgi:Phosphoglycerate kinase